MSQPIADHALISDCQTAALVDKNGSIEWWCVPRFDSPSIFGRLLDDEAGYFYIKPTGSFTATRRYVDQSMVLQTTFTSETGIVTLTDALALGANETGHKIGLKSPHILLRTLHCTQGRVRMRCALSPRPEYGEVYGVVTQAPEGAVVRGGAEYLRLSASIALTCSPNDVQAEFFIQDGETISFALARSSAGEDPPQHLDEETIQRLQSDAVDGWQSWAKLHQSYKGVFQSEVHHSGRVLQALTYQPTGSIIAAPTTSLPESIGGNLNWDYRFSWVRDASMTMEALWIAACPDEADRYFMWLANSGASRVDDHLQIMFGVGGEHDLAERELAHLSGWRGSLPVRVGNAAWSQKQNDVYGAVVGAAFCFRDQLKKLDATTRNFIIQAIEQAARIWQEPDQGIWELRGDPQFYVHSALTCWVALTRGSDLSEQLGVPERRAEWRATAADIATAIRSKGWNETKQSYTQTFDNAQLDASLIMLITSGFLEPDDPQARATLIALEENLSDARGLLRRFVDQDAAEGSFLLCTFWLAQAWAIVGESDRARLIFERALSYANDVGLLSEEVDTESGELIGNFPQAFSHLGLINAASAIEQSLRAKNT